MEDITLNQVDFNWVDNCEEPRFLKKALRLLKEDGGFFPDLEKHIIDKLANLDKKFIKPTNNQRLTPEELKVHTNDILNWENEIKRTDRVINHASKVLSYIIQSENHNERKAPEIVSIEKKKLAENEKIKGNEIMKTKEFDLAINHYTISLRYDPYEPTTYCNRALAYIRVKSRSSL